MSDKGILWFGGLIIILLMIVWAMWEQDPLMLVLEIIVLMGHLFIGVLVLGGDD